MFRAFVLEPLIHAFEKFSKRNAYFINSEFFTYEHLSITVSKIRKAVQLSTNREEKNIGLIINDDLETYATIIALWLEGKAYIPINPENPIDRNNKIIHQADLKTIIGTSEVSLFSVNNMIMSDKLPDTDINLIPNDVEDSNLAYIFFTSGTTGEPKGVPITRSNVVSFVRAFWEMGLSIDENDKVLQMFELTFDLSVMSYLVPMLKGSCIYTIPKNVIKYQYIVELLEDHGLTVALMVPSIIHYLRKYFNEIDAPQMRYSLFCGEALPLDVTQEWSSCVPNAEIYNVYGPTENTIFCTTYAYKRNFENKTHNGILSIGKAMFGVETFIIDENNQILGQGEKGELCLAGDLLTPGYWKNEEKNKESFFIYQDNGINKRLYKTGDLCVADSEGDILYLGRIDFQTKIQGFRVELSEIEFHAKAFLGNINLVALPITNSINNTEIGMVFESADFDTTKLIEYLNSKIPGYMIPTKLKFISNFPLNVNGKTDRKKLINEF